MRDDGGEAERKPSRYVNITAAPARNAFNFLPRRVAMTFPLILFSAVPTEIDSQQFVPSTPPARFDERHFLTLTLVNRPLLLDTRESPLKSARAEERVVLI